jgi:hypothetical protein
MAVKRPPDTWVSQVLTLKGFRDEVYSEIDGSLVGYIKDGKFIQTIDELPKIDPKKKKQQDPGYIARLKESQARLAINILKQSAVYFKELAEDVEATPKKRAEAEAKLDDINRQIETRSKDAGQAVEVQTTLKKENNIESATKRSNEIQIEFDKLQKQREAVLNPGDPKAERIKKQQYALANEYANLRQVITQRLDSAPISDTAAFGMLTGTLDKSNQILQSEAPVETMGGPTGSPAQAPTISPAPVTTPKVTTGGTTEKTTGGTTGGSTGGITTTTGTGQAVPSNFNVGTFRMADEASMAKAAGVTPGAVVKTYDAALAEIQEKYNLPDIIFSKIESLGSLLDRYVNPKKYGKDGISDIKKFTDLVKVDPWYRANEGVIRKRYIEKFNYEDLVKSGKAVGNTVYEQDIRKITDKLVKQARELGSAIDETQARLIAEDLYIHNQDGEESTVTRRLVSGIRPMAGMIAGKITEDYSGLALTNYQGLQKLAKRNGLKLEGILPPNADGTPARAEDTLKRLALGEIDPTRLAQDVRKLAAVGQPQFVRDLLGQGIDLDEIYSPYRRTMANILELDENQIDLMDPTLRMGINDKGDVNLYDYSKALRQDSRWQYTGNARKEVSDSALTVLRNFGFQG